ncbi:MAG: hypothetical protein GY938_31000 [Ketobacter sp.]|nr:hypothetical protein [Ketobacter sp.]
MSDKNGNTPEFKPDPHTVRAIKAILEAVETGQVVAVSMVCIKQNRELIKVLRTNGVFETDCMMQTLFARMAAGIIDDLDRRENAMLAQQALAEQKAMEEAQQAAGVPPMKHANIANNNEEKDVEPG